MKKFSFYLVAVLLALTLAAQPAFSQTAEQAPGSIRNVILLIPDGMSVAGATLARLVKGSELAVDPLACGLVNTWNSDGTIADSAPAGSAYATGWKSQSGNIATLGKVYSLPGERTPSPSDYSRPVATILEAARLSGRSTGIVSTSEFMHATPADFSAHDVSRANYDNLTEQIVYNDLTVVLGGGGVFLNSSSRKDKEDLLRVVYERGYTYANDTASLAAANGDKLFGTFGKSDTATSMSYDIDRDPAREPSLRAMTSKALEILNRNKRGFFLMVEGSEIDWAAHANDPAALVGDILAFDKAVKAAVDFAKTVGNTAVVVVTDHGNSGISIGDRSISSGYDKTVFTTFIDPIKRAKLSGDGLAGVLPKGMMVHAKGANGVDLPEMVVDAAKIGQIKEAVAAYYGIDNLTDKEAEAIASAKPGSLSYVVGPMLAARAKIGFTTNGHTGEDVVLYVYDPTGNRPTGYVDNTAIAEYMAASLGVNLDAATAHLFVDAKSAFEGKLADLSVDAGDPENPVLVVTSRDGSATLRVPRNKSVAYLNGAIVDSDGVAVYNGASWFVSQKLIDLIH